MTRRLPRFLLAVAGLTLVAAACASGPPPVTSDATRTIAPSSADSGTAPLVTTPSTSTTTSASTTTTMLPPQTTIWVGPDGDAASDGRFRDQPTALDTAIDRWLPGLDIVLLDGRYEPVRIQNVDGTADVPLVLRSENRRGATLSDGDFGSRAGIRIHDSSYIVIDGVTIVETLFGISVTESSFVTLKNNDIHTIGQEGIHVRDLSHDVIIEDNTISDTGNRPGEVAKYPSGKAPGEGIYLGTGRGHGEDEVFNVWIRRNEISYTTHEAIDVKAPVHDVVIEDNYIHHIDTFVTGALVVHLNQFDTADANIEIRRNRIHDVTSTSQFRDGNCIVLSTGAVTITNNVIYNCQHRGIFIENEFPTTASRTVVVAHNTMWNTGSVGVIVERPDTIAEVIVLNNLGVEGPGNATAQPDDFVDVAGGDFRLAVGSDAVDAGVESTVLDDLAGTPRPQGAAPDLGAYETPAAP